MRKYFFGLMAVVSAVAFLLVAPPLKAGDETVVPVTYFVDKLSPSWDVSTGVFASYYYPNTNGVKVHVSPGQTAIYTVYGDTTGYEAGIIKAGITPDPLDSNDYWDEGLFAFIPTGLTTENLASSDLNYYVVNETGENAVWMTIEIDTGIFGNRDDNVTYECVPEAENQNIWHRVDVTDGGDCMWNKWTTDPAGNYTGIVDTDLTLEDVANDAEDDTGTPLNVIRVYLRLGMGNTYNGLAGLGTKAWVDYVNIGNTKYDFVVVNPLQKSK